MQAVSLTLREMAKVVIDFEKEITHLVATDRLNVLREGLSHEHRHEERKSEEKGKKIVRVIGCRIGRCDRLLKSPI